MDSPCCEVEKGSACGRVLVPSRQAETEVGLEKSLTVGLVIMSPVLHGGGRSRCA